MSYKELSEEDLYTVYHKTAMKLSFHNAAEGGSWHAETAARNECKSEYKALCQEYKDRNLDLPKGNYLI